MFRIKMELVQLCKYSPLYNEKEWSTDFVKVVEFNTLNVSIQSDVPLILKTIHSFNGSHEGPMQTHDITVGWSNRIIRRTLPYMKFIILNKGEAENNNLILSVITDKKSKEIIPESVKITPPSSSNESRSKSPFTSILKRKKIPDKEHQEHDRSTKIPEIVGRNSILCGDWNNKIKSIPPPILGINDVQILSFRGDQYEWLIMSKNDSEKNITWRFD